MVTPQEAVRRGLRVVNGPVLFIMAAMPAIAAVWGSSRSVGVMVIALCTSLVAGPLIAWVWWSFAIPRWRDWVEDQGLRPADVQALAEQEMLVWPEGHPFERTELPRRDGRRGW